VRGAGGGGGGGGGFVRVWVGGGGGEGAEVFVARHLEEGVNPPAGLLPLAPSG